MIWRLFLGLVVCTGSACVTPTHASSASPIVLTHIQAAHSQAAKAELVIIYNNSSAAVDITNWCIKNKSNVKFICFTPPSTSLAYFVPPFTHVVAATEEYISTTNTLPENVSIIYPVTNQSSGSIVNANDTVSLVDADNTVVDYYSWVTAIPAGKMAIRFEYSQLPLVYETFDPSLDWRYDTLHSLPESGVELREIVDEPPSEEPEIPDDDEDPSEQPVQTVAHPLIVEVLANPAGVDAGNEFIEIYNPNSDSSIDLSGYILRVGQQLEKSYVFPVGTLLTPLEYRAFYNSEIHFTLLNSTSSIQLELNSTLIGSAVTYSNPKDGQPYVMIDGTWAYAMVATPNTENSVVDPNTKNDEDEAASTSEQKPCAANQYRSLETNRCRLIAAATTQPAACKAGQERNPETGRCRNSTADAAAAACKEGQERNPETNRCRNIVKMSEADYGVKGVSSEANTGTKWYWWLGIGGVVALILGYAVWEWREELSKIFHKITSKFARTKP